MLFGRDSSLRGHDLQVDVHLHEVDVGHALARSDLRDLHVRLQLFLLDLIKQLDFEGRGAVRIVDPGHADHGRAAVDLPHGGQVGGPEAEGQFLRRIVAVVLVGAKGQRLVQVLKAEEADEGLEGGVLVVDFESLAAPEHSRLFRVRLENHLRHHARELIPSVLDLADVVALVQPPLPTVAAIAAVLAQCNLFLRGAHDNLHGAECIQLGDAVVDCHDAHARLPLSLEDVAVIDPLTTLVVGVVVEASDVLVIKE